LQNYFTTVKSLLTEAGINVGSTVQDLEKLSLNNSPDSLLGTLAKADAELVSALSDSFDTPRAMRIIYELIKEANIYMNTYKASANVQELASVARWVTKIVGIFGLDANASAPYNGLGWASSKAAASADPKETIRPYAAVYNDVKGEIETLRLHSDALDALLSLNVHDEFAALVSSGESDPEAIAMPYLRAISRMRDELRRLAPQSESKKQILILSDRIRDQDLTNLGVYLDDRPDNQPSLIKFVPKEELIAQREEKAAKEWEKAAQKEAARLAREKLEAEKAEKAKIDPRDMFRSDEKYSEWDAEGLPTRMKDGSDVPKSQGKKLKKDWDRQKKLFDEYNRAK
jgi:cysteinyl-tRNA synthetase